MLSFRYNFLDENRSEENIKPVSKHKLLLADDSVTIQKVVNLTFADEGIEVVAVGDGDAAMLKFVESVPDLVMVDVNMPGIDGYQICEMIKQDEETKHIPVILLVGSFEPFDEEEARRVGADDFLTKPFQSIRQLVNKVSDLLNGKKVGTFGDEPIAVNNFDDTLEMLPPSEEMPTEDFGDTALDDEMIQTDQIGSLPVNEAQKFESAPPPTSDDENLNSEAESGDEDLTEVLTKESLAEVESLPEENFDEDVGDSANDDSANDDEPLPRHENIYEFANEQELEEEKSVVEEVQTETVSREFADDGEIEAIASFKQEDAVQEDLVETATASNQADEIEGSPSAETLQDFELDDFDLLELPQSKQFKGEVEESAFTESSVDRIRTSNLSPEEIEAIADKVVEKLSDRVIKKIVREVLAQMTKES